MTTWDGDLFLQVVVSPLLLAAAWTTIWVATVAQAIGTAIGTAVAPLTMSRHAALRIAAWIYQWIFRGTPLLAQILFFYAVLPLLGVRLGVIATGLLALGLNEGARMAEIVRGGLLAVPREQREAGAALGLRRLHVFALIVMPQALRAIVPPLCNNYSYMIKATSLLSVISFAELLRTSQQLAQSTARPLEIYTAAAVWYLVIVSLLTLGQYWLERRLARAQSRAAAPEVPSEAYAALAPRASEEIDARPIVIEARGVSRRLGTVQALDTVDIELRHGETIVIVGPSGSGKSTLLRCLNWLETPDAGEIRLAGETVGFVTSPDGSRRPRPKAEIDAQRRRLGMVFQRFNLFEHLTALRNVAIAPERVLGLTRDEAETRARTHLVRLGLGDRLNSLPGALSGGQKQRVAIARALAMRPEALLLDEPTSALDPESVGEFLGVLRDLARDGVTMAVVTHELGFARAVADRLIVMDRGRIVEAGPPAEVLDSPRHPRTVALLSALSTRPAVVT